MTIINPDTKAPTAIADVIPSKEDINSPSPNTRNPERRAARMASVAAFLSTKQLTEFERAAVKRCMAKPYAANEDDLLKLAEPYYRGDLVQLLEVLEGREFADAQASYEIRRARSVGLGPSGSPKMHYGFLTRTCSRHDFRLPSFETRRIDRAN